MGDEEDGVVLGARHVEQERLHAPARLRVERAERLVHEHEPRAIDERARDRDALLHAAGELLRIAVGELGEPDGLQIVLGALPPFGLRARPAAGGRTRRCRARSASRTRCRPGTPCRGRGRRPSPACRRAAPRLSSVRAGPATALRIVDFPQPEGPRNTTISPMPGLSSDLERHVAHRLCRAPGAITIGHARGCSPAASAWTPRGWACRSAARPHRDRQR